MILRVAGEGQYTFADPVSGLEFRADYLRRDSRSGELNGELSVSGGSTDGVLSVGTFNFSSVAARSQRAKLIRERAKGDVRKADVLGFLEAFCQYIATQERIGDPAVTLRDVQGRRPEETTLDVLGMKFPTKHLALLFGAPGTMKSYLAMIVALSLALRGLRVLYVDWELEAADHRHRLECLRSDMPDGILYCRCRRPLIHEIDRLRRIGKSERIDYYILDSVGYGTAGDPAAADAALDFCRAAGQLATGVLALAHITKNGENNDQMPYGSMFWHASARCTYNVKLSSESSDGRVVNLGVFHRKNNLGRLQRPIGIEVTFNDDSNVTVRNNDIATVDAFRGNLPTWQVMQQALRGGPLAIADLAAETGKSQDAIKKAVQRGDMFTKLPGAMGLPPRIALVEMRTL